VEQEERHYLMKSFERGHAEERRDVSEVLTALAGERKNPGTESAT
jgi:hypothetical protein